MELTDKLSPHFTFGELTVTDNRNLIIQNETEAQQYINNLTRLCADVLEPVRELIGVPIHINSGFRCLDLNNFINGSKTSQHCHGEAADTIYLGFALKEAFNTIAFGDNTIPFSQIIFEFGRWIHLGVIDQILYPGKERQIMTANVDSVGKTFYTFIDKPL